MDAAAAERREIREQRFTSLDRLILRRAGQAAPDQPAQIALAIDGCQPGEGDFAWTRQQNVIARLNVLEAMGLAQSTGSRRLEFAFGSGSSAQGDAAYRRPAEDVGRARGPRVRRPFADSSPGLASNRLRDGQSVGAR